MSRNNNNNSKSNHNSETKLEEYKIAVVGGGGVGKSAITVQFVQNIFIPDYDPTIEDSYRKHCRIGDQTCFLEILDTAGQEEYKALRDAYMRSAECFMLVFSVIDRRTFHELEEFHDQILRVKDADEGHVPMILVGNKCDLESERSVSTEEAKQYAREKKMLYMECSARKRHNIDESFHALIREVQSRQKPQLEQQSRRKRRAICNIM